ncbi:MAG: pyruvate formate lyase family protein, partial [Clostridia bacterium]|nr:pyruvate formate lyase family protein [Clostridia bacterium]
FMRAYINCIGTESIGPAVTDRNRKLLAARPYTARLRRAYAEAAILKNMEPKIGEDELIVGRPDYTPLTEEEKKEYRELELAMRGAPNTTMLTLGHMSIDYPKLLRVGVNGLVKEIKTLMEALDLNVPENLSKYEFYEGSLMELEALLDLQRRYAEKAAEMAKTATGKRKEELERLHGILLHVPAEPARDFYEALQAVHFYNFNLWELYYFGRVDQYLYPYYEADVKAGRLTYDDAVELFACFLLLPEAYILPNVALDSMIGGTDANGESQVNDLSYLMLDATEQLDFVRCLSVRYGQKTEKAFLQRALEVVGHVQKGIPFFFNDDVMIPALEGKGISREDAADYTQIGCVETVIPGKSNPHAVTGRTNLLKALEYVFCNGASMMYPQMRNGIQTGELWELDTFEKFYDAVLRQIRHILDVTCHGVKKHQKCAMVNDPKPYKSLLTEGCLENGKDFNREGAKYDYYLIMLGGVPNLADSLEVIRKFVYEEQKYSLPQVRDLLIQNYPDETVRLEFVNKAPKFG